MKRFVPTTRNLSWHMFSHFLTPHRLEARQFLQIYYGYEPLLINSSVFKFLRIFPPYFDVSKKFSLTCILHDVRIKIKMESCCHTNRCLYYSTQHVSVQISLHREVSEKYINDDRIHVKLNNASLNFKTIFKLGKY